jgi:hypothetical protein
VASLAPRVQAGAAVVAAADPVPLAALPVLLA